MEEEGKKEEEKAEGGVAARRRAEAESSSASVAKRRKGEEEEEKEESHRTSRTPPLPLFCYSWLKLDPDEWGRRVVKREGSQSATAESNLLTIISAIRKNQQNFILLQTLCLTSRQ